MFDFACDVFVFQNHFQIFHLEIFSEGYFDFSSSCVDLYIREVCLIRVKLDLLLCFSILKLEDIIIFKSIYIYLSNFDFKLHIFISLIFYSFPIFELPNTENFLVRSCNELAHPIIEYDVQLTYIHNIHWAIFYYFQDILMNRIFHFHILLYHLFLGFF